MSTAFISCLCILPGASLGCGVGTGSWTTRDFFGLIQKDSCYAPMFILTFLRQVGSQILNFRTLFWVSDKGHTAKHGLGFSCLGDLKGSCLCTCFWWKPWRARSLFWLCAPPTCSVVRNLCGKPIYWICRPGTLRASADRVPGITRLAGQESNVTAELHTSACLEKFGKEQRPKLFPPFPSLHQSHCLEWVAGLKLPTVSIPYSISKAINKA